MEKNIRRVKRSLRDDEDKEYIINLGWKEEYSGSIIYKFNGSIEDLIDKLENDVPLVKDLIKATVENKDDEFEKLSDDFNIDIEELRGDNKITGGIYNIPEEVEEVNIELNEGEVIVKEDLLELYKDNIKEKYYTIKNIKQNNELLRDDVREAPEKLKGTLKDNFIKVLIDNIKSNSNVDGQRIDYSITIDEDIEYNYRINIKF